MIDPIIFIFLIILMYWIIDNVWAQVIFSISVAIIAINIADYVTFPAGTLSTFQGIIGIIAILGIAKTRYLMQKKIAENKGAIE